VTAATLVVTLATIAAGALGALVRVGLTAGIVARRRRAAARSWGTASVNLAGTALLAGLVGAQDRLPTALVVIVGVGFAGALTTHAGWVVDAVRLARAGERSWSATIAVELVAQALAGVAIAVLVLRLLGA
jgi:fluoride ion exporter CrcB/FEX